MEAGSLIRYDYVRMVCRMAPGYGGVWKEDMLRAVAPQHMREGGIDPRHGQITNMWDGKTKKPTMFVELWGPAADLFMAAVLPGYYSTITRLDVRAEIPTLPIDYLELLREVKKVKTNARRTTKYIDSPPRTKREGRDAGGSSVIVGASGSRRRLCVYLRTGGRTALEVQFGDREPARFVAQAQEFLESKAGQEVSLYKALLTFATQQYYDAVADLTGHSYAEFAHLDFWHTQDEIFSSQEETLAMADELFNRLDPEGQAAFMSARSPAYSAERVSIETAKEIIDAVAPITYTDEELEVLADKQAHDELLNGEDRDRWENWY